MSIRKTKSYKSARWRHIHLKKTDQWEHAKRQRCRTQIPIPPTARVCCHKILRHFSEMGGFSCEVKGCTNTGYSKKGIKYFSLPGNFDARCLWIRLIGLNFDDAIKKSARVCSDHFPESYHTWTCQRLAQQAQACGCTPKGLLPSLNLPREAINDGTLNAVQSHLDKKRKENATISR
jgi:THAP domain